MAYPGESPNRDRNKDTRRLPETQADFAGEADSGQPVKDILSRIIETKRAEIDHLVGRTDELRARALAASPTRDFLGALARPGSVSLIAEVKRRSPGAGPILPDLDPSDLAREYASSGASALSVLTDREYFQGSLEDLSEARSAVDIPVLRKDFLLSPVQVFEARAAGADAVLLIVRILDDALLRELRVVAEELGMTALVEVHDSHELTKGLASGAEVIGINNRNLEDFTTRLQTTVELLESVPDSVVLVSESGVRTRSDVEFLGKAGVDAVLVGEALLRASAPGITARELSEAPASSRRQTSAG